MESHYVLIDCDRVQDYVFASTRLKEICNASLLLDWLETEKIPELAKRYGGHPLRSGGGVVILEFNDGNNAIKCITAARSIYQRYGISATFSKVHSPAYTSSDFYQDVLKSLFADVRTRKDMSEGIGFHISTILSVPCESSGICPAERPIKVPDGMERRMNKAEAEKRLFRSRESDVEEKLIKTFSNCRLAN